MSQLSAFGITLACEVPVILLLGRHQPMWRLVLIAVTASAITHPLAWKVASILATDEYRSGTLLIEAGVIVIEALWYRLWLPIKLRTAGFYSLTANACSFAMGWVLGAQW